MSNKFLLNERGNLILKKTTKETLLFISLQFTFFFFRSSFYFTFLCFFMCFCCCFASDTHAMYDVMSVVAMKLLFGICPSVV